MAISLHVRGKLLPRMWRGCIYDTNLYRRALPLQYDRKEMSSNCQRYSRGPADAIERFFALTLEAVKTYRDKTNTKAIDTSWAGPFITKVYPAPRQAWHAPVYEGFCLNHCTVDAYYVIRTVVETFPKASLSYRFICVRPLSGITPFRRHVRLTHRAGNLKLTPHPVHRG